MNDKIYIICVEFNSISTIKKFEAAISKFGEWMKIITGVYAIKQPFNADSSIVMGNINAAMNGFNCQIFIMKSSLEASWNISSAADGWLRTNI